MYLGRKAVLLQRELTEERTERAMNFTGVYHKTSEQMSYPKNDRELIINIKTGYDVKRVFLHYGDPFESGILGGKETWTGKREEICYKKRLKHQIWWTTTVVPAYRRCKYYFELQTEEEIWYYFEDGFLTEKQMQMDGRMLQCFIVPWMNPADINRTPGWVNETVWYQIFPDRFCNGTPEENTEDIVPWRSGEVTNAERFGGNLAGIRMRLSYLKELGINGIYLNPIMEAESNHKYDTTDYTKIDSHFGTNEEFAALVKEAHALGIRVMVDAVLNHCGRKFAPWRDVQEKGRQSVYADWFMINDWISLKKEADTRDGRFYSFAFIDKMPKLNTNNEEVIAYFCKICENWIREFDIDGIRFDVGNEVSHRFLKQIRDHVRAIKPDLYLLGEIWHDASQWLNGEEYDSVMNYPLMSGIHDFFLDPSATKEDFEYMINRCYTMYMQQNNNVLFNLLDSHDTERLMNRLQNLDRFYQQLAVLFTMPGSPCIYYGTEIAMEGGYDPDCRRCMPWSELSQEENQEKIREIQTLITLRKEESAFRSLYFHFPNTYREARLVEYVKLDDEGNQVEILLNGTEKDLDVKQQGEVLFARAYDNGKLRKNGTLIRRGCI
jgi:cyclomaltodextrinase